MSYFRFPVRRLPIGLHDFASEVESLVDQVMNHGDCKSGACSDGARKEQQTAKYTPAIDVFESDSRYDLYVDLPGVKPDQVKVEMHEERLLISGSRTPTEKADGAATHRTERVAGEFVRSIRLPKQVDVNQIEAVFEHGVLHVGLPKQVQPTPRTIQVRTVS